MATQNLADQENIINAYSDMPGRENTIRPLVNSFEPGKKLSGGGTKAVHHEIMKVKDKQQEWQQAGTRFFVPSCHYSDD